MTATPTMTPDQWRDTQSEAMLQAVVITMAERLGFLTYSIPDSRRTNPGYPDVHIVGHGVSVYVECKTAKGRVRREQKTWLAELQRAGIPAMILRPKDVDRLEAMLTRAARDATSP